MSKKRKDGKIKVITKGTFNTERFAEQFVDFVRLLEEEKSILGHDESKKTPKTTSSSDNRE
ncbi:MULTISPECIES: hypothetical protein [Bacillus cereus group]|jgi:hypothetical protein|uniref:hypothetical protein n=1 Tax=Bacillus cereus group TaxID=86661 RepID=UPI000A3932F4|nr:MULTISPECIES: hypothetical protein [Bacillus cereus group]MBH0319049.1 hypothetical protein [Bacillus cereus]MEC3248858.1 hypothetical protein [Bacillus cereus]NIL32574.1 hypothetical protein [Bacillus thuringiensis]OUA55633.1 hypothetical protein BK781_23195 [Bacillus thuringiensis serovar aizawai]